MGDGRVLSRCHCDNTSGSTSNGMNRRVAHVVRRTLVSNKEGEILAERGKTRPFMDRVSVLELEVT